MPTLGFDHYNFRANRALLAELKDFYCSVVGLSLGPRPPFESFGYWLYAGDKDVLHLTEERADDHRRSGADLTFDHVAFNCRDQKEYESRLQVHGIAYERAMVPDSGQHQLFFRDPAGNGIELNFLSNDAGQD